MNKTRFYIITGLIALILIVLLVTVLSRIKRPPSGSSPTTGQLSPIATPTIISYNVRNLHPSSGEPTIFQQTEEYIQGQNEIRLTEAPEIDKAKKLGALQAKVPYKGKLFTFNYNTKILSYQVIFDKDRVLEANKEFDAFLKENDIESRSWFRDLKITYQ